MKPSHQVILFKNVAGDWCWNVTAKNGRVIAQGEGYRDRSYLLTSLINLFSAGDTLRKQVEAIQEDVKHNRRKK